MTILIYTDASTKEGVSCWAFKTSLSEEVTTGIELTTNTAAMETLAVIKAIESIQQSYVGIELMIISDFLGVVKTITNQRKYIPRSGIYNEYHHYRDHLLKYCKIHTLDALWVASHCPNRHHQEVDQASKLVLQEYLKTVK